jgi:hypothetical protein
MSTNFREVQIDHGSYVTRVNPSFGPTFRLDLAWKLDRIGGVPTDERF